MSEIKHIIRKAAVLGAGVMGAQIAAHLTNAGIETILFDLPSTDDDKSSIAKKAIAGLKKLKPSPLTNAAVLAYIQPANYEQHLEQLTECDFVIEAIAERLDWKLDLYKKVCPHLNEQAILASNTSGLSINALADVLPDSLKPRFCGVHFFNPPRYMHLVELIPSQHTDARIAEQLESFLVSQVGKGVVHAKDTANFIANRIGVFSMLATVYHAQQFNIDLEIVDALTGTAIKRPKSATLRTMDVVGLDTMAHVIDTMAVQLVDDPWHGYFQTPEWINTLIKQGALGQKTGAGIYKKVGKQITVLDLQNKQYRSVDRKPDADIMAILAIKDPRQRFDSLRNSAHPQAQFLWSCFRDLFHYCAYHLNDIADNVRDVDLALRWGFGWQQGPFETWQTAGWQIVTDWLREDIADNKAMTSTLLPEWTDIISEFYTEHGAFSPETKTYQPRSELAVYQRQIFPDPVVAEIENAGKTLYENNGVRLWHTGDDIGILSFKSKVNAVGDEVLDGILAAMPIAEQQCSGVVIWQHDPRNFSVGANLKQFADIFTSGDVDAIETAVGKFQKACLALRYSMIPTVAALRGRALGGGCEIVLHCDRVVAAMESYIGLVEVGVGLLPAGGGCKELALRASELAIDGNPFPLLTKYFNTVAMAEVAASAHDARNKGFLRAQDNIVMNEHELLFVAKQQVSAMQQAVYRPPLKPQITVAGAPGIATLQMLLVNFREGGFISDYDYEIGSTIAEVMCGGQVEAGSIVDEEWLLRLERQNFAKLAVNKKTQERIAHILKTGKPLRN